MFITQSSAVASAPIASNIEAKVFHTSDPSDKRRFLTPAILVQLQTKLSSLFPSFSKIQYLDEEEDLITISSQEDLDFVLAKLDKSSKCLRLVLASNDSVSSSSPTVVVVSGVSLGSGDVVASDNSHKHHYGHHSHAHYHGHHHGHHHHHGHGKSHARFVEHVTCPPSCSIPPSTPFIKSWRFRNEGKIAWAPASVELIFVSKLKGDLMGALTSVMVQEEVPVGGEAVVSVQMVSPSMSGKYQSYWRLRSIQSQKKFGQRVLCEIQVGDAPSSGSPTSSEEEEGKIVPYSVLLDRLREMGFDDMKKNVKLLRRCEGDLDKVIAKLIKKRDKKQRKEEKKDEKEARKEAKRLSKQSKKE